MIKASELRIGNLVMDRGGKTLVVDYWEGPNKIAQTMTIGNTTVHPLTEYCDYLQPILLTPEILEACGFERDTPEGWWTKQATPYSQNMKLFQPNDGSPIHYADGAC